MPDAGMLQFLLPQSLHKCILSNLSTPRGYERYHNRGAPMESKTNLLPLLGMREVHL